MPVHRPGCWLPAGHRGACRRKTNGAHGLGLRSIVEEFHPELGDPYTIAPRNGQSVDENKSVS